MYVVNVSRNKFKSKLRNLWKFQMLFFCPVHIIATILAISPITLNHSYCSMVIKLSKIVKLERKSS